MTCNLAFVLMGDGSCLLDQQIIFNFY